MESLTSWEIFALFLRDVRQRNSLTQKAIAELLGCSQNYIWRLEHGKRHPSTVFLRALRQRFALNSQETRLLVELESLRRYDEERWVKEMT